MKGKQGHKLRRQTASNLLTTQLKNGLKFEKIDGKTTDNKIPLTEKDRKRIKSELETLKTRI